MPRQQQTEQTSRTILCIVCFQPPMDTTVEEAVEDTPTTVMADPSVLERASRREPPPPAGKQCRVGLSPSCSHPYLEKLHPWLLTQIQEYHLSLLNLLHPTPMKVCQQVELEPPPLLLMPQSPRKPHQPPTHPQFHYHCKRKCRCPQQREQCQ